MATNKFKLFRVVLILFPALVFVYASQAVTLYYGIDRQTTAGELLLFIPGSIAFLFVDMVLLAKPARHKIFNSANILYLGWILLALNWFVTGFLETSILSWANMLLYTVYCVYLSYSFLKRKPVAGEPE
jgi:hypothetical protein